MDEPIDEIMKGRTKADLAELAYKNGLEASEHASRAVLAEMREQELQSRLNAIEADRQIKADKMTEIRHAIEAGAEMLFHGLPKVPSTSCDGWPLRGEKAKQADSTVARLLQHLYRLAS